MSQVEANNIAAGAVCVFAQPVCSPTLMQNRKRKLLHVLLVVVETRGVHSKTTTNKKQATLQFMTTTRQTIRD